MGAHRDRRPRPSTSPARGTVVLYAVIGVLGLTLIGMAIVIGIHVGWVLSDTIVTPGVRGGSSVWAWVPMVLLTAAGSVIAVFGFRTLGDVIRFSRRE